LSNITVTNNNTGSVILENPEFRDALLTFTGAATVKAGTILARDSVSGKLVPFVKGGSTNENGIPKEIITYDVVAAGAGDESVRSGILGEYKKELLVIDADGDASNVDIVVEDKLRVYGLTPVNVKELNILDNQ